MDIVPETADVVRCAACHELYEHTRTKVPPAPVGCPHCGETAWLSARVPVEESTGAVDAPSF